MVTAVWFWKVLQCPLSNINIFYYNRKLSSFNFTVFDMGKKKAICYLWDESVEKRGANEVSSCLLNFIQTNVEQGTKEFRFWSDNCAGQNCNRFVYSLYIYAAKSSTYTLHTGFYRKGIPKMRGTVSTLSSRELLKPKLYIPLINGVY